MWPANTNIKNTLSGTDILLFVSRNLQLNPTFDFANTILEKKLLTSTINTLNAIFDQEEKFKLAILLRDYIYSCYNLEQLRLDLHYFWNNYFQFLQDHLAEHLLIIFILFILAPVITLSTRSHYFTFKKNKTEPSALQLPPLAKKLLIFYFFR